MNNIFELQSSSYGNTISYLFNGPEVSEKEFISLCDSLLEKSTQLALINNKDRFVEFDEIVKEMASLLPEFGYKLIIPKYMRYGHTTKAEKLGRFGSLVIDHNDKLLNPCNMLK